MADIVEQLRERARGGMAHDALDEEAAAEIERLQTLLKEISPHLRVMRGTSPDRANAIRKLRAAVKRRHNEQ